MGRAFGGAALAALLGLAVPARGAALGMDPAPQAALLRVGPALPLGADPAAWAGPGSDRLCLGLALGPARQGAAVQGVFRAPAGLGMDAEAALLGDRNLAPDTARLRLGLARSLDPKDEDSAAVGAALVAVEQGGGAQGRALGLDLSMRLPVDAAVEGLSLGWALRELPLTDNHRLTRQEADLSAGWSRESWRAAVDLLRVDDRDWTLGAAARWAPPGAWRYYAGLRLPDGVEPGVGVGIGALWLGAGYGVGASLETHGDLDSTLLRVDLCWRSAPAQPRRRRSRAVEPPAPTPVDDGSFDVRARVEDGRLHLEWPQAPGEASYDVMLGLVPGATMRRVNVAPLKQPAFSTRAGVAGLTYYYRVLATDTATGATTCSRVLTVGPEKGPGPGD